MNVNAIYALLASWKKKFANLLSDFFGARNFLNFTVSFISVLAFFKKFCAPYIHSRTGAEVKQTAKQEENRCVFAATAFAT